MNIGELSRGSLNYKFKFSHVISSFHVVFYRIILLYNNNIIVKVFRKILITLIKIISAKIFNFFEIFYRQRYLIYFLDTFRETNQI